VILCLTVYFKSDYQQSRNSPRFFQTKVCDSHFIIFFIFFY
jgi:hypothetical protein